MPIFKHYKKEGLNIVQNGFNGKTPSSNMFKDMLQKEIMSYTYGEITIFCDERKAAEELLKAIDWNPNLENLDYEGLVNANIVKEEENNQTVEGLTPKKRFDCCFFGLGIGGDFYTNIANMFKLSQNQKYNQKLLRQSDFVMKFDYTEAFPKGGNIAVGKDIYVAHKRGESLLAVDKRSWEGAESYYNKVTLYSGSLENLIITDFFDRLHAADVASNLTDEDKCSNFMFMVKPFQKDSQIINVLKKYKTIIETIYGKELFDIYSNSLERFKTPELENIFKQVDLKI